MARSNADGYTLLAADSSTNISPLLSADTNFKSEDIELVGLLYWAPWMLLVSPDFPAKTLPEMMTYGKANPGKISWAHQGVGSVQRLLSERFLRAAGIQVTMVPYSGSAPASLEVMEGRVDMTMDGGAATMDKIKSGRLRPLAISSEQRFHQLPDLRHSRKAASR